MDDNDDSAIAEFRQQLENPSVANRFGGDLPSIIQNALLNRIGLTDRHHRMALAAKLRQLRESLTLPTESPILQLLAERVATCWLHLNVLEWQTGRCRDPQLHKHLQQMVDRVQRRYLSALKTLAEVRRLNLPAIQVNVAQQQVVVGNLAQDVMGEEVHQGLKTLATHLNTRD